MKVLRSTLVAAVAFVAAACGDKVTVAAPPVENTTPAVNSVTVTPSSVTLNIGQSVTFTAVVDVKNGAATTVTWASSASNVTVTAAGAATAVTASPGVAVCATSTADATKKGCATVVVAATQAPIPATVSLQSITVGCPVAAGTCGLTVPINPTSVRGNIDVTANVAPGNETVSKIEVLVGTTVAASQTFTASQAAALRFAAEESMANQSAFPPVTLSINTAAFNATTGVATYLNGNYNISVKLYVAGTTAARSTATYTTALTFANANTFVATVTVGGTTATANNAGGFKYTKGDLSLSLLPVSYTGVALASANVNFGTAACDASLIAQRTNALTAPAAGSSAWTVTFANSGTAGATNLRNYEFSAVACATANATGETFTVVSAQGADGNVFTTTAFPITVGGGYRVDNTGPGVIAATPAGLVANPNGRANSWINDAVVFTAVTGGATSNNWIAAALTDAGVSGVTYGVRASTTLTVAGTSSAALLTNAATLAPSATNGTYCGLAYAFDALGNSSPNPAACVLFGVDRDAPLASYAAGSIADLSRFAAAPGAEFIITGSDQGLVGNSGLLPTNPGTGKVIFRGNGNTAAQACFVGAIVSSVCTEVALAAAAPNYSTSTMAATAGNTVATEGYYTFSGTIRDAAGNSTAVASRITLVDATVPTVGAASGPLSVASGYTFPVSALVNENLDIQNFFFNGTYGAAAINGFNPPTLPQGSVTAVNGYNAATFVNTNYAINSTFNLPVAMQANMSAAITQAITAITASATNQANTVATGASAAIPTFGTAATAISTTNMTAFTAAVLPVGKTGISSGLSTAATTAKPASSTLSVTTTGATAVFNNPFSRVDFYGLNVAGTAWVFLGTTTAASLTDDGVTRTFTYTIPVTGSTVFTALGGTAATINQNVIAFGLKADGSVAMVNAAALVLNVVY